MTREFPHNWRKWLPLAEWWYNSSYHSSLQMTPFEALYGYKPNPLPLGPHLDTIILAASQLLQEKMRISSSIRDHLAKAQQRIKYFADQRCTERTFEVGDWYDLKMWNMETFSLYLLSLAVVLVSFIFLGILSQRYNSNRSKVPPGTFGFPLIGETIQFLASGPEKFFHRRMEKYSGDIFTTSLFGEKVAVVCGAAGNKFLLYTANHQLTPWIPSATFKLLNWMDSAGQSYKQSLSGGRIFLNKEMLKPEILRQYITIMDSLARQHINTYWDPSQVACRLLLGVEDADQTRRIYDSFSLVMQGLFSIPINLPGTTYNRALKETKTLKQQFLNIIAEKKKTVLENKERAGSDVLSRTLLDENANSMSNSEIGVYIVSLMLPSYEAASASLTLS
ncbi:beta-amyrin 6-beta-monooxygenase-like [Coffea arabica]|uniref:Beta-amyrin 6-beta-monooxygenase-like n=1 Tax=Coffea arabica TaxID=13443 RepID=A0A6P6SP96_COFAR|nr:beta-amyrin 28-monooxygenase-like [Coffea arabica]